MKIRDTICTLALGLFLCCYVTAQEVTGRAPGLFTPIDAENLNSLSFITAIVQDPQGFIWFGGKNGLARFDGYEAVAFRHDPNDPYSLGSNDVSDLLIDKHGNLWVATLSGGGLNFYDAKSGRFIRYQHDPADPDSIANDAIYGIAEDKEGDIWIATHQHGINKLDVSEQVFRQYSRSYRELRRQTKPSGSVVKDVVVDNEGIVWLATQFNGVDRFDPKSGSFTNHPIQTGVAKQPESFRIKLSRKGQIWVGSYDKGLFLLDKQGQPLAHYHHDPDDPASLGRGVIWDVMEDAAGQIWVATGGGELNLFDADNKGFVRLQNSLNNPRTPSGTITKMYQDNAGDYWFGSYFSTIDFLNANATLFNALNLASEPNVANWPRNITAMAKDLQNNLWIAADRGLSLYNFDTQTLTDKSNIYGVGVYNEPVRALLVDRKNQLWVGTLGDGIYMLDEQSNFIAHYTNANGLKDQKIWALYESQDGSIWAGTQSSGIARLKPGATQFEQYLVEPLKPEGLSNSFVWDILETEPGSLWIATQWGLNQLNIASGVFSQFVYPHSDAISLSSDTVKALAYDGSGTLWVATATGLNKINVHTGEIAGVESSNTLEDNNLTSLLIYEDEVWFSTQRGVGLYHKQLKRYFEFDTRHGINGRAFVRKTGINIDSETLAFGGENGVTLIRPEAFRQNEFVPPVVYTDFRIEHQRVAITEEGPLREHITQAKAIYLQPQHAFFSLKFSALSYRVPSQNRYSYKLEGFDDMWHQIDANERRVTFTNLDPGDYVLLVKAANSDGLWNDSARALNIYIAPHWWQTWWARTLAAACLIALLYLVLYIRIGHIRKRQTLLKTLVEKKTKELALANTSIRELNLDLEARVTQRTYELSLEVEERRHAETKLYHMACHDSLTELPNRYWLIQELKKRIERLHENNPYRFSLLFLDGDRFKQVNDTHGHLLGDQLLVAAASRLKKYLSVNNHVVRLGGDEFTVLIDDVTNVHDVEEIAKNIISAFEKPFFIEQNKVVFQVSIGIVICEELYSKPEQILRDADIALYRAKDKGRGCYQIFDAQMREETIEANVLEQDLQMALKRDEMFLEFQPIVSLSDGKLMGFEALLRWDHPERQLVSPDKFIPIAEESNLIGDVGLKALNLVCEQLFRWKALIEPLENFTIAVNVSSLQVSQMDLLESVDKTLRHWNIDGRRLKFEITETALMEKSDSVKNLLENLRSRGVELAIDDFGTGYSSLSYLDQLPVQILKIDRSFVSGLVPGQMDGGAIEIVRATISMAHNLRMKVVAEGIETQEQLHILQAAGCDFGQGYWFAKPLPESDAEAAIKRLVDMHAAFEVSGAPDKELKSRVMRDNP